ncbi:MAG: GGDEF domain-containing protein [Deltaproteobacteria bacterium]|nr:GGDEF domain-containing protein [Deltaproteobacteria bacterium]
MTGIVKSDDGSRLAGLFRDFLYSKALPDDLPADLSGIEGLPELYADMIAFRNTLVALSRGDLSRTMDPGGFLPGVVKDLQAGLKHLTWQTQRIARGDFTQRVDFMGEFSEAFNAMVAHLSMSVKALRESEERFRRLSITDPLTGLYNRRHFFEMAEMETERANRYGSFLSLCLFDIDSFKSINDTQGHDAGDIVLRMIADTSRMAARKIDVVARYGGEEFIVAFPETGIREAGIVAERIRKAIEETRLPRGNGAIRVTASFGVAVFDPASMAAGTYAESLQAVIRQADEALYRAKNSGKNRVVLAA